MINPKKLLDKTAISIMALIVVTCGSAPSISQANKITPQKTSKTLSSNSYTLRVHIWDVSDLAFTKDGNTLVSGSLDETIQIWNLPKRKLIRSLSGNKEGVNAIAVTPDGLTLASAGGSAKPDTDKVISITNLKTGKVIRTLTGHAQGVTSLSISPDGQTLVSGSYDKTIKLWNLNTGQLINTLTGHGAWVRTIAISPSGNTIVSGGGSLSDNTDTSIKLWDLRTGKLTRSITANTNAVSFVNFTPDGQAIVSGDETAVKTWNVSNGELINTIKAPSVEGIKAIAISPDGTTVATTSLDASVRLWSVASGKQIKTLVPAANNQNLDRIYPSSVRFSPDGKTVAIGHGGGAYNSQFLINIQPI